MSNDYAPVPTGEGKGGTTNYPPRRKFTVAALSLGLRRHRILLRSLIALFVLTPFVVYLFLGHGPLTRHPAFFPSALNNPKCVLLVVAHPDDECLFFSPSVTTILQRASSSPVGHILVISSGDHYGLGSQRRDELHGSCEALGVAQENCEVLNLPDIQDDPTIWWPESRLGEIVLPYVDKWAIDLVVTFDNYGVSGHINHRALSAALVELSKNQPSFPPVYLSISILVTRKYSGLFDLPLTGLFYIPRLFQSSPSNNRALLVGSWNMYRAARRAFKSHASQLVWDRWLYMILSRYMYFNELTLVT